MTTSQLPQNKPLYEQVCELIETRIIEGDLRVGDKLPTENEMAEMYQLSRTVIREAMKALKEKGRTETRVGKGTFVVDNVAKRVRASFACGRPCDRERLIRRGNARAAKYGRLG